MPIAPAESTVKVWRVVGVTVLRPIVGPRSSPATSDGPNECVGGLSAISGPSKSKRELAPSLLFEVEMFTTQKSIALRWGDNAHTGAFSQSRAQGPEIGDPQAYALCHTEIERDKDHVKLRANPAEGGKAEQHFPAMGNRKGYNNRDWVGSS